MASVVSFISQTLTDDASRETIFNWDTISKLPLPMEFIEQYHDRLNWNIICKSQPISIEVMTKFSKYMNFEVLASNPNLSQEVILQYLDKMDWETLQKSQKFTREMILYYRDSINYQLIFNHQKVDEDLIIQTIEPLIGTNPLEAELLLTTAIEYQTLSCAFFEYYLEGPHASLITSRWTPICKFQELTESFIVKYLIDNLELVITTQKVSAEFIEKYILLTNSVAGKVFYLLTNQELPEEMIMNYFDELLGQDGHYLSLYFEHQDYSLTFAMNLLAKLEKQPTKENINGMFRRILTKNLSWTSKDIETVVSQINFVEYCSQTLSENILNPLLEKFGDRLPWYILIKNNKLTEKQLIQASQNNFIGAIEWWTALSYHEYPAKFCEEHRDRKKWWKYIHPHQIAQFFENCIYVVISKEERENEDIKQKNLRSFLKNFARKSNWNELLRDNAFEEWFLTVFSHLVEEIPVDQKFWWNCSRFQKLSEAFIRNHLGNLDLNILISNQILSENILLEIIPFCDETGLDYIRKFQSMTLTS